MDPWSATQLVYLETLLFAFDDDSEFSPVAQLYYALSGLLSESAYRTSCPSVTLPTLIAYLPPEDVARLVRLELASTSPPATFLPTLGAGDVVYNVPVLRGLPRDSWLNAVGVPAGNLRWVVLSSTRVPGRLEHLHWDARSRDLPPCPCLRLPFPGPRR